MIRVWRDYVVDILTSIQEVEDFTRGMDYRDFAGDKKTVNAVVRSLEIMGEAAKRVPEAVRQRYPDVPWKRMTGMRDKLIHEYSGVDLEIVWGVVKTELPPVKPLIDQIFEDLKSQ
ncbi:MAG: DUF86 domain-containing protein [Deltaproteobacteria bacterium]|nr:DUF86 domain-containing protein [Deltaproteobacteria bacterium]